MTINFELWLLIATVATGLVALIDKLFFEKRRLSKIDPEHLQKLNKKERYRAIKAPFFADYSRSLFLVLLVVFLLRSFAVEPFRIPSGSMLPTLKIGDFILVNKFSYGLRMPITNKVIIPIGKPKRGDIVVFKYPANPEVDFIKRLVGLPGDKISYINKELFINGKEIPKSFVGSILQPSNSPTEKSQEYREKLGKFDNSVLNVSWNNAKNFKNVVVPKGEYFVMGDNRDFSEDSRYWGFVPAKNLVGKAFFVWFSWNSSDYSIRWNQIGTVL